MMRRLFFLMPMLAGLACSRGDRQDEAAKRYFYFTSDFPEGMSWRVIPEFASTTDSKLCKAISSVTGDWIPARKAEAYDLRASGDTLKVPMFWNHLSPCDWNLSNIGFEHQGHCMQIHSVTLVDKNRRPERDYRMMPDTLGFVCKTDTSTGCWNCDEESGKVDGIFRMESNKSTHFHIEIRVK